MNAGRDQNSQSMSTPKHIHDVLVIGAGLSGATAGALLLRQGYDVVVLEAKKLPCEDRQTDWLGHSGRGVLKDACAAVDQVLSQPVHQCTLFTADLARSITPAAPELPPYLIDYHELVQAVLARLRVAGNGDSARVVDCSEIRSISPGEEFVSAKLADGTCRAARLLLLATGARTPLPRQVGLEAGGASAVGLWTAAYRCPVVDPAESGRMDFILGLGPKAGLGYRMVRTDSTTVGICVCGSKKQVVHELVQLSRRLSERQLIPTDACSLAERAVPHWSPAGCCLEMDNHVAKRTLIIGEAGGFVAAYSNEGLYPAMWSAQLACRVVVEALGSSNPQDKLRQFDHLWRTTMVEHLRSPNADQQSILPLIFSNQQMADKTMRALVCGTNF